MKIISRLIFFLLITVIFLLGYMTFFGLETKKFNNQIIKKIKNINNSLELELKDIKLIFDPINFRINAKTIGPKLKVKNEIIEIENIKTQVSLRSLINNQFSLENLEISSKSLKIKDLISFIRVINNSSELYVLEKIIRKGYLITDIKIDFDDTGKIKDNYSINGLVKDIEIDFFNKYHVKDLSFIFNFENKQLITKDSSFKFNDLVFSSEEISVKKMKNEFSIKAFIDNNKTSLSEKKIKEFINPFISIPDLKNITFSSKNIFSFTLDNKFKIKDLETESEILLYEVFLKNSFNLKSIFPKIKDQYSLINHKLKIKSKADNFLIEGSGDLFFQEKKDNITYKLNRKGKVSNFSTTLKINNNPFNLDFLNYEKKENDELEVTLNGFQNKKKQIVINKFLLKEGKNQIEIQELELNSEYKFSDIKNVNFDYFDKENKRNLFRFYKNDKEYFLKGPSLNANYLIEKVLDGNEKETNFSIISQKINIDIDEVSLDKIDSINNLTGYLSFNNKKIFDTYISAKFSENKELKLKIKKEGNEKVTTLFVDKAEPIIKRYNFIKGFEDGKLDFQSIENNEISESKLKIYDFKLKEMPALTKILTLASLQGIADVLSGEGIRFDEFEMIFQNKGNLITIKEIYAIGPSISIMMEGYIEKDRLVSLKGTLVPATTINKFIGSLPVLGEILVGKKIGEGVFGVSFKIKGPPKKLETSVNPIKTLTPRFITRTLEKLKKN